MIDKQILVDQCEDSSYIVIYQGKVNKAKTFKEARQIIKRIYTEDISMKVMLEEGAYIPIRAHDADAGLDLRCRDTALIEAGASYVFDTGVHIALPTGTYGKIESKSGLNVRYDIVSCGGTIDEGYTGSIKVKLYNLGNEAYVFDRGDKIAQLIIMDCIKPKIEQVETLSETERGDKGFGSTGK